MIKKNIYIILKSLDFAAINLIIYNLYYTKYSRYCYFFENLVINTRLFHLVLVLNNIFHLKIDKKLNYDNYFNEQDLYGFLYDISNNIVILLIFMKIFFCYSLLDNIIYTISILKFIYSYSIVFIYCIVILLNMIDYLILSKNFNKYFLIIVYYFKFLKFYNTTEIECLCCNNYSQYVIIEIYKYKILKNISKNYILKCPNNKCIFNICDLCLDKCKLINNLCPACRQNNLNYRKKIINL